MTDSQSNKLDMYIIVKNLYIANQTTIDLVNARTSVFTKLADNITSIYTEIAAQSSNPTGVAVDKTALRNGVDNMTNTVLQSSKAWAVAINNNTLIAEFDYSLSDIKYIKDDTIQGFCDYRIGIVTENIADLADYGIDAATVTEWQNVLNAYTAVLESPREAINARHMHTQNLKNLFAQTQDLLTDQIDPLMVVFKTTDPSLYAAYKQSRMIIDRGRGPANPNPAPNTATLFGTVTNAVGGTPIEGAMVVIVFSPEAAMNAVSNENGEYRREGIPPGEYAITASATGYISYENTVILEANATFELNISLVPEI